MLEIFNIMRKSVLKFSSYCILKLENSGCYNWNVKGKSVATESPV
jgi:hypothetical protein